MDEVKRWLEVTLALRAMGSIPKVLDAGDALAGALDHEKERRARAQRHASKLEKALAAKTAEAEGLKRELDAWVAAHPAEPSEFPCPHCRGMTTHEPTCITVLAEAVERALHPAEEASDLNKLEPLPEHVKGWPDVEASDES